MDNGSVDKTKEQLVEERLKRYQDSPDSFIEVKDILVACLKESGVIKVVGGKGNYSEYCMAYAELITSCGNTLNMMRTQAMMQQEAANNLVKPVSGGIMDFARRKK